ncbi:NAD-dependent dihydropyrimidine dehydrogenase subunit PreA [Dongshaea marina]|uniref:NAD-dependent dihydropyrimidine dehydrogenase subunit PreA n=1 Tax=Dongshaea marina TaxID=2047966 RepID=UPI000D3E76BA|nr:NAD-dependent dihydropyrimidine dehydrogenase subunit PreA [Dongshaea marina]
MPLIKDLSIEMNGVRCENPFFLSSSPVSSNYEMCARAFDAGWAGVVYKTIGFFIANEVSPRFDHVRDGSGWSGFKNMEQISDKPLERNLEMLARLKRDYPEKVVVASIMGSNEQEWQELARLSEEAGVDILECNFSCPQMTSDAMGSDVGQNDDLVARYTAAVKRGSSLPVWAKMTPNIGQMEIPALAAQKAGANGIAAINTVKSLTGIDLNSFTPEPQIRGKSSISGYSGRAIKPIALRFIAQLMQHPEFRLPISGQGGIYTWEDAVHFLLLGSRTLQVTTSVMEHGYRIVEDLKSGLSHYMQDKGFERVEDMVGLSLQNTVAAEELNRDRIIYPHFDHKSCIGCGQCHLSCQDGAHQAIHWDHQSRKPTLDKAKCPGCHLCLNVCPVAGCITPGEVISKQAC